MNVAKNLIGTILCRSHTNGVTAYVDAEPIFEAPMITVERVSGTAFVQLSDFITVPDDLLVLKPKRKYMIEFLLFAAASINMNRWKYCYGRKLTKTRIIEIKISLPIGLDGEVDFKNIDDTVCKFYGLDLIKRHVNHDNTFENDCVCRNNY